MVAATARLITVVRGPAGARGGLAIGQVLYLRPSVEDYSTEWALSSVTLLTVSSVCTTYIGERISDMKLGNGTLLLIFTSIISYLPASFGLNSCTSLSGCQLCRASHLPPSCYLSSLVLYMLRKQKGKFPSTMPQDTPAEVEAFKKSAYLPFKVNRSGGMPVIFSTSSLALPGTAARLKV